VTAADALAAWFAATSSSRLLALTDDALAEEALAALAAAGYPITDH
jgi:hypothetical protein